MACWRKRLPTAFVLIIGIAGIAGATGIDIPADVAKGEVGGAMATYMGRLHAFGFHGTVLVAHEDEIVFHAAYGLANPQTGVKNTTATLFSTGSVTKQFTATAILRLEMEGKLSTDDRITLFFDDVPPDKQEITIHHLLTHTSGLEPSYDDDDESIPRDAFMTRVLNAPLLNPVGETYEYSNAGYSMLAAIVEKLSGMSWEAYLRETLYLPNGLDHTGLYLLDVADDQVAHAHNPGQNFRSAADRPADAWNLIGNGGQLTTTADMYRWQRAVRTGDVLSPETREKMFTRHVPEDEEGMYFYGYGWSIVESQRRDSDVIWHNGGAEGMWSCAVYEYVDDNAVFIVFANSTVDGRAPVDDVAVMLSRILFGENYELPPVAADIARLETQRIEGSYALSEGGILEVTFGDGMLHITPKGQAAMTGVFPSPMDAMLPKYNGMTEKLIGALAKGHYEEAAINVEMDSPEQDAADWVKEIWQSFDEMGAFQSVEAFGTKFGSGAETYCRLHFSGGSKDCRFYWMMGRCVGFAIDGLPQRSFLPQSETEFATYSLSSGRSMRVSFDGAGQITMDLGDQQLQGRRK